MTTPSIHAVIVDEELPYPPTSGKRIRILNLVKHLARRHRITLLCHQNRDADELRLATDYLHSHGIETVTVQRQKESGPSAFQKSRFCARLALNLLSPVPYSVQWNECRRLQAAVRRYAADHAVDIWQCEWAPYATALAGIPGACWAMMAHDIQSLIWERYTQSETNSLKRWYIRQQWHKYRQYEQRIFGEAALTITVTEQDAARASSMFAARRTAVVDNGVDVAYYQAAGHSNGHERNPNDILFLGNLAWRANLDAVRLLLDEIFPMVLTAAPSARLCIVGRQPPKWLIQRARLSRNVELHPDVPDVRPFLYRCGAMAVPLRIGGGSRLKILEALATGLPVVSTQIGAEGLRLRPGVHFVQADHPHEMAQALIQWIRSPESTRELARAGELVVAENYDWSILAQKMEEAWLDLLRHRSSAPPDEHLPRTTKCQPVTQQTS
jgi:polysaccharide biosynthesis protein PslH